jgi:hypothetical protein
MKLAHLILAHRSPEMIERLVKRLQHPDADIYIHLDTKQNFEEYRHIAVLDNVRFLENRVKTEWGDFSLVQATLNGFEEILQTGNDYTHINLLSGQDYPLKSAAEAHKFLFANTGKTFIHSLDINGGEWDDGRLRIARYSFGDYNIPGKYKLNTLINAIMPNRKMPFGLKPYGRSQWFTITPECARYCNEYIKDNPGLKRYFRKVWAVDEVFFQTILENSPLKGKIVNDNLRYIQQSGPNRPATFTMQHKDVLTASGKLYARKFDTGADAEIFDYLDSLMDNMPI